MGWARTQLHDPLLPLLTFAGSGPEFTTHVCPQQPAQGKDELLYTGTLIWPAVIDVTADVI